MSPPREAPAQTCVWPVESGVIGVPRAVRGGVVWSSSKPRPEAGCQGGLGGKRNPTRDLTEGETRAPVWAEMGYLSSHSL